MLAWVKIAPAIVANVRLVVPVLLEAAFLVTNVPMPATVMSGMLTSLARTIHGVPFAPGVSPMTATIVADGFAKPAVGAGVPHAITIALTMSVLVSDCQRR